MSYLQPVSAADVETSFDTEITADPWREEDTPMLPQFKRDADGGLALIEIVLIRERRARVDVDVDAGKLAAIIAALDPGPGGRVRLAGHRAHRHAARVSGAGFAGSGNAEGRSARGSSFCLTRQASDLVKIIWHAGGSFGPCQRWAR